MKNMTFEEFYQKFGQGYPLAVVKTAYGYFKQGHRPEPSLSTAAIIYAAKQEKDENK